MSVQQLDRGSFDSTVPPQIQGNAKIRNSSYALLTIGAISVAIGIIGILAHQGVLGKKVLDSLKKIPNSIGGKDLVLGVSIVLVGLPPIVLLICIAKSERDVDTIIRINRRYVHKYDRRSGTLEVTHGNISNIFKIRQEVVTVWVNDNYNAMICGGEENQYILSIHYKNRNDQSCIYNTVFTIVEVGFKVLCENRPEELVVSSSSNTYHSFNGLIRETASQIKDAKEPLKSLIFEGPNGLVKKSLVDTNIF